MLNDLSMCGPGTLEFGRQVIHCRVALIANRKPLISIEYAQALRHITQCNVESHVLYAQVLGHALLSYASAHARRDNDQNQHSEKRRYKVVPALLGIYFCEDFASRNPDHNDKRVV